MLKKLLPTSLLFTIFSYGFITIEPLVPGEKEDLSGEVAIGGKYSSGNTNSASIGLGVKTEYSKKDWLLYFISEYSYEESDSKRDKNNGRIHARYLQNIDNTPYNYELFFQTEFDEFRDIKQRSLTGANIRRKLNLPFDKFYTGLGLFYSYMEPNTINTLDPIYKRIYMNSYISFLKNVNKNFFITYLGFFQPNVKDFSDFRTSQTLQFNTSITTKFRLGLDISYNYTTKPYSQIKKSDIESIINLKYSF
ncbi:MAG: Unknown protein [uncultured Sulfurovum sp.]|uniref:DUF481 domain-containing protein n=1 Tax=uncultured Sulfurovum sp. TaxID=269237 RepID=A0A6S6T6Y3_9BACT|nr:MAG: Unknown protein [uncultured Sulfurovum sp.]